MAFIDELNIANTAFYNETVPDILKSEITRVDRVLEEKYLDDKNRAKGESLKYRLQVKLYVIEYLDGFSEPAYGKLISLIDGERSVAEEKKYLRSVRIFDAAKATFSELHALTDKIGELKTKIYYNGIQVGTTEEYGEAVQYLQTELEKVKSKNIRDPFGEDEDLVDVKGPILTYLTNTYNAVKNMYDKMLYNDISSKLSEVPPEYRVYNYFPTADEEVQGQNTVILSTPVNEEAFLYAINNKRKNTKLRVLNCASWQMQTVNEVGIAFDFVKGADDDLIITDVTMLKKDVCEAILYKAMLFGKSGKKVYIVDEIGDEELYKKAKEVAAQKGLSHHDISRSYVTMPIYSDVETVLKNEGAIGDDFDREERKEMAFMGFVGLNKILSDRAAGDRLWLQNGKRISDRNEGQCYKYMRKVHNPALLIDEGWGITLEYVQPPTWKGQFDYDGVREIDLGNIKKIVESNLNIFAKCGIVIKYCLFGGDDSKNVWSTFSREEMSARLEIATKLVYRLIGIPIEPKVGIYDDLGLGVAGMCCDGGPIIKYAHWWVVMGGSGLCGTVAHESHHALQHQLGYNNYALWTPWYSENLGITLGRLKAWTERMDTYSLDGDVYKVHVIESESNAFAEDCKEACEQYWKTIDFD